MIAPNQPLSDTGHPRPLPEGGLRNRGTRIRRSSTVGGGVPARSRHPNQDKQRSSVLGEVILTALFVTVVVLLILAFNSLAREGWMFFKETVQEASVGMMLR